jgi:DNA-binding XRE family transcriptional regulator
MNRNTTPLSKVVRETGCEPKLVAVRAGVHPKSMESYLRGVRRPQLDTARRIAAFLSNQLHREVTLDEIFPMQA